MMLLLTDTDSSSLARGLSNRVLTYSFLSVFQAVVGVCYEQSLFERTSLETARLLSLEDYAHHVRDGLKTRAYALRGSTELPLYANNFHPPLMLCCGRHSLQAWGILRKTPFFKWVASTGMLWCADFLAAAAREIEYRKGSLLPLEIRKAVVLAPGYAYLTNHPEVPEWWPVTVPTVMVRHYFGDRIAEAEAAGMSVPLDRLSATSCSDFYRWVLTQMADEWLVFNGTRPPTYLGTGRQWYCVPTKAPLYYSRLEVAPSCPWEPSTYWVDAALCPQTRDACSV